MKNRKFSDGLVQVVLAVAALVVLGLLVANVTLMLMASYLNTITCNQIAQVAAESYNLSANPKDLQIRVFNAINGQTCGGFFISNPTITELKCYNDSFQGKTKQMISVKTSVWVRLPAPFLVIFTDQLSAGRMLLNSKCIVELKPAHS